ncbi:TPA: multidrug efflux RND transporter periplasmic adaptor subunit CmeA [Campylobacter coli]|uniref:multidrug efflux RND transporter periplasmic adaptor subunit CmeA n=1 Tax=Campylobacter coli TaxID=195 RepID=UPI00130B9DAA|nr:multidrug efflux RND transporter periplasmic adaptor subunit CmeA [Campylobacter coli]EAI7873322.1 multidrug efflux RND transporter periplasmic adaptor subunit CmeA [Campylobacter coli]ECR9812050.1 multidrug efflux RND transporter periplasmic adaptor subunit CmeA [Campylobacter coli]NUJ12870.1 Multidrug export protein AcrE precursor [Campylobacter coli]HEC1702060.1 multidrug efflux RND transporter periplasmic adaptor subunit CmeA [Campylobacter coli]HEC1739982.1 multidrug efflux RND transpo
MNLFQKNTILALGVVLLLAACSKEEAPKIQMPPQPVTTMSAKSEDLPLSFTYPAKLVSDYDVIIKPQVSGVIVNKLFKAGDKVKKGQTLFIIEQDKFKASVNSAYGKALMARANFDNASKDYNRSKTLYNKGAISQKEYDSALANFNNTKANLTSARADLENARIDLAYTEIKAPFDGIVGDALINIGDYVSSSSTELVRITNLNPIYADFYISDTDKLNIVRNTQDGKWDLSNIYANLNLNGETVQGKLYFIDSVIDANSGTVKAKAVFDNNNSTLLPGAFATITSEGFIQKNGFKVPQIAVKQDQNDVYVLLVKNGKVEKSSVHISYQNNEYAIIDKGLQNGDKIILDNFKKIQVGSEVKEIGVQ